MKKLITIFLCVISIFTYYISYKQFENLEWKKISNIENFTDFSFMLTDDLLLNDPEVIYPIIQKTAIELEVNILRNTILYSEVNTIESDYFVFLSKDTELFQKLSIKQGRYLSPRETQSGELFLSSKTTENENQIGTIKVFGNKHSLTVKPLIQSYSKIPVAGEYFVESIKQVEPIVFYNTLAKNFNEALNQEIFTADYFISQENNDQYWPTDTQTLFLIKLILACVIGLFIFYNILHRGKVIAIHKMLGIKNIGIWFISIGKLLIITFLVALIVSFIYSIFQEGINKQFIIEIIMQYIETYIIITAFSIIALFYIIRVKISSTLKNRKDTRIVFIFNLLLKMLLFISSIFMMITILEQLSLIDKRAETLENWQESSDYGVFYPFYIGLDEEDLHQKNGAQTFVAVTKLYELLNQNGSLLINTKYYEQQTLGLPFEGIRSISLNPNYLEKFPILSENNEEINVEESIQYQLLLVPNKYKDRQQEILSFFDQSYLNNIVYEENNLKMKVPEYLSKPNHKIIWTKDQQEIFSFNPDVFPAEENVILDPIIRVITENNSLSIDKRVILGGGATDPLKVKLSKQDPSLTFNQLKLTLQELELDDNLKYLVRIDDLIFKELSELKQERFVNILVLISIICGTIYILVQNTILMFYNYQKTFIIHSLFGTGFFKTYQNILYIFFGTWLVQIIIVLLIDSKSTSLTLIIILLLLIEFLLIITTITILEKKNRVRILKGGM